MSYGGAPPPPPPGYGAPPYGAPYGGMPTTHPRATMILVFGILGLVVCMPFGIASWVMGNTALREIDASGGAIDGRGQVQAGRILGIISVGLSVLGAIAMIAILALGASVSGG